PRKRPGGNPARRANRRGVAAACRPRIFPRDRLMHVLLTRPEPDASTCAAQLEALGHAVTLEPLLRIERLPIDATALDGVAGVIVTSRNRLRELASTTALHAWLTLAIMTVCPVTAQF